MLKFNIPKDKIKTNKITGEKEAINNIMINDEFIGKIRLLSWHILTITKKQKISTLKKYLDHIKAKKHKNEY